MTGDLLPIAYKLGGLLLPKQAKTGKSKTFEVSYFKDNQEETLRGDPIREEFKSKAKALARVKEIESEGGYISTCFVWKNGEIEEDF